MYNFSGMVSNNVTMATNLPVRAGKAVAKKKAKKAKKAKAKRRVKK